MSIVDLAAMDIADLHKWMSGINRYFNDQQKEIRKLEKQLDAK